MIHQIFALTVKELKVLWRDREALLLLFAMPLFFILVMSWALQGVYQAGSRERPIEILVVNRDLGKQAAGILLDLQKMEGLALVDSLNGNPLTSEGAETLIRKGRFPMALEFREDFSTGFGNPFHNSRDKDPPVVLIVDPAVNRQILSTVQGTIQGVIERRFLFALLGPDREGAGGEAFPPGPTGLEVRQIGGFGQERRPTATEQHVPAYTIFGVFFIVLTLASGFLREKQEGTFRRILTAPMHKSALLVGKLIPYYLLNLVQIGVMFAVGVLVYQVRLGSIPALIVLSLALAASANGLGLLVAAVGRTEAQVNGLSVLLAVTLSALGGMMVPSFIMPQGLRLLSRFTPHAWALEGYHDVMIRGLGVRDILPESGVLLGFAILFFAFALWRFRFGVE
jgi:ABC-2 type transport system permease protein